MRWRLGDEDCEGGATHERERPSLRAPEDESDRQQHYVHRYVRNVPQEPVTARQVWTAVGLMLGVVAVGFAALVILFMLV